MKVVETVLLLVVIGAAGAGIWHYGKPLLFPCAEPLTYSVTTYDARFGLSEAAFADALKDAAALLNEAAGKTVIAAAPEGEIAVELVYGDKQEAAELGEDIDGEQQAYEAKRTHVEALRSAYLREERSYDAAAASYERRARAYQAEVERWNRAGGAPPETYEALQQERRELEADEVALSEDADRVNAMAAEINVEVEELNRLARALNAKVNVYNEHAGEAFDQGRYIQDASGKRIQIYEFTDGVELRRVLAHEFGHALGMDHVENPESILYSFNIGTELELTPEDIAELRSVCRIP